MKKVKIGVIGAGLIGQTHLDNYAKIELEFILRS